LESIYFQRGIGKKKREGIKKKNKRNKKERKETGSFSQFLSFSDDEEKKDRRKEIRKEEEDVRVLKEGEASFYRVKELVAQVL